MNQKGIKMIHDESRPLAVSSMNQAMEVIAKAIAIDVVQNKRFNLEDHDERESYCKHLLWLVGFDALIRQRDNIHAFVDKLVED